MKPTKGCPNGCEKRRYQRITRRLDDTRVNPTMIHHRSCMKKAGKHVLEPCEFIDGGRGTHCKE